MARAYSTFSSALRNFLHVLQHHTGAGRTIERSYSIAGATGIFRKYLGPNASRRRPRFTWVTPCPEQYEQDMSDRIHQYLTPFAVEDPNKKEKEPERKPKGLGLMGVEYTCGVATHRTDTEHYKQLLDKVKGAFDTEA